MDSNFVNSQRRYLVRVHDQQGKQIVNNKIVTIGADSSYTDVFSRLELGAFKLLSASVLTYKNTPESDATDVEDLNEAIEEIERTLDALHIPRPSCILFAVRAERAAPVGLPGNAFAVMMHSSSSAYERSCLITAEDVRGWISNSTATGGLAQQTCSMLQRQGAGFFATDSNQMRKEVFLVLNNVFWAVTPRLKKSLQIDLAGSTDSVRHGWQAVAALLGKERLSDSDAGTSARYSDDDDFDPRDA